LRLFCTLTFLCVAFAFQHECIHDQIDGLLPKVVSRQKLAVDENILRKRGTFASLVRPIRVLFDTRWLNASYDSQYTCGAINDIVIQAETGLPISCSSAMVLSSDKINLIVNQLLPVAQATFYGALNVLPLSNFTAVSTTCGSSPNTLSTVPPEYRSGAMTGVDLVVFVTARPVNSSSILAFASNCESDASSGGRPILGYINFNPSNLNPGNSETLNSSVGTALHELTHVLGFSYGRMSQFVDPNNNFAARGSSVLIPFVHQSYNGTYLASPEVLAWGKYHFGCSTMIGVEIENEGAGGTALSHWKRRIFNEEYRVGVSPMFPIFSNFTLAYLDDSGWYLTNRSWAVPLQYGLFQGCSFIAPGNDPGCDAWSSEGYRCRGSDTGCTANRLARAICPLYSGSTPLPAQYKYGSDGASGTDLYSEYCPHFAAYLQTTGVQSYCTWPEAQITQTVDKGESYCQNCRCFVSSLGQGVSSGTSVSPSCYNVLCTSPSTLKIIVNKVYYTCPVGTSLAVEGYGGTLSCPSTTNLCYNQPVIADWPEFVSISPSSGTVGTSVTIMGTNFVPGMTITIGGKPADNIQFVSNTSYTCSVSSTIDFTNLVSTQAFVILTDSQGRTAVGNQAFGLQVTAGTVLAQIGSWLANNPGLTAAIVIGIVILLGLCIFLIYRERQKARYGKASSRNLNAEFE